LRRFSYSDDPAGFLSSAGRIELEACVLRQREDHGIACRANAILLPDDGESCARIAKFLYLDDDTIRGWHKTYLQDGWDALAFDGWKGGQSRMTQAQEVFGWKRAPVARRPRSGPMSQIVRSELFPFWQHQTSGPPGL
jgi:hypothetical protein